MNILLVLASEKKGKKAIVIIKHDPRKTMSTELQLIQLIN